MQLFTTFLAYGYLMIVGVIFVIMLIQVLAFYIAGRLTGSINDEFVSALSLFGALFLIGMGSSLANAAIQTFMPGSLLPLIAAAVLFLFITLYAIAKIYDLSILSSILHFIISFGIMVIVMIGLGYLATRFVPEGGFQMNTDTTTDTFDSVIEDQSLPADSSETTPDVSVTDEFTTTSDTEVTTDTTTLPSDTEEAGGPKLPGAPTEPDVVGPAQ